MFEGSNFVYDERRKELRGSKTWLISGEEEIKSTLAELEKQRDGYAKAIATNQEIMDAPEMTPELEELKEKLTILQRIKLKTEKGEQIKEQIKQNTEDLAEVKKDIDKIKQAIGSRLNL